jgi:uncharacterized damage-inducible protein DinB
MPIKEALLPEYDHEMETARKLLERVPLAEAQWKPHAKSMTLGELTTHIVEIPGWVGGIVNASFWDMASAHREEKPAYASNAELLAAFDQSVAQARAAIAAKSDAEMMETWSLKKGDAIIFSLPKAGVIRSYLINHLIHHRGQLSVYIRLKDVPVPSIYGPSADEPGM